MPELGFWLQSPWCFPLSEGRKTIVYLTITVTLLLWNRSNLWGKERSIICILILMASTKGSTVGSLVEKCLPNWLSLGVFFHCLWNCSSVMGYFSATVDKCVSVSKWLVENVVSGFKCMNSHWMCTLNVSWIGAFWFHGYRTVQEYFFMYSSSSRYHI